MIAKELLAILVCPKTKGKLTYKRELNELWSVDAMLAYPVRDGIPVMIESEARALTDTELGKLQ